MEVMMTSARARRVRPGLRALLAVAVVLVVAVPIGKWLLQVHDARLHDQMTALARAMVDPPGLSPLPPGVACDLPDALRCSRTQDPDVTGLARSAQRALGVAAGQNADLSCTSLPIRHAKVSSININNDVCTVTVTQDRHLVMISIHHELALVDHVVTITGTRYALTSSRL